MATPGTRSRDLFREACELFPGGVNSPVRRFDPYPFFALRGRAGHIYSVDGHEYIDLCMGYGALILGHAPEAVVRELSRRLADGTLYGTPTEGEVELAKLIREAFPSMEMLRLVNSGTEATMHAIRLARAFTGRWKVVKFDGAFHGSHDYVLAKAGVGYEAAPTSEGIPHHVTGDTLVVPFNDLGALEQLLDKRSHEIAALIVEPVLGNAGLILPEEEFLSKLVRLARSHGVLTIFDEVITGFRLAFGGAQEYYGVKADLTALSKALGGGLPLACYGGRREIMEMVAPLGRVYQAGTYSGNPLSVAAGLATLRELRRRRPTLYRGLEEATRALAESVREAAGARGLNVQVHHIASMLQLYFTDRRVRNYADALTTDTKKYRALFTSLLGRGIFIPPSNFEACFLSAAHTEEDIERVGEAFRGALGEIRE